MIEKAGPGAFYVFDCLSRLAFDWWSDPMPANFFMLTCPYLFDLDTITHFAPYRNYHTSHAVGPIQQATQLFIGTYRHEGEICVRPVEVQHRYSPTIFAPPDAPGHPRRVIDAAQVAGGVPIRITADAIRQKVLCYFER